MGTEERPRAGLGEDRLTFKIDIELAGATDHSAGMDSQRTSGVAHIYIPVSYK